MASERQIFSLSGPVYLTVVDWRNLHHRRSVAASLVQGVSILERDRQQNRQGPQALAPPWWEFFHFQLMDWLVDDDHSIFGAIFEFKFPHWNYYVQNPARYVVAFRGTITKLDTRWQDLKLDLKVLQNSLQQSTRFQVAMQAVQNMVDLAGAENIWLAGHSLGSAIALLAGKNMVKIGCRVETYLFNPPFPSAPIEEIKNKKLKHWIRFTSSVVTAGIAVAVNGHHQSPQKDDSFSVLSDWIPYLFVNPSDPISNEYIWYFEHRLKMMKVCDGSLGRLATQNSVGSLLSGSEPAHLIPSAYLTINLSPPEGFKKAHGIHQWWKPNMQCQFKLHQFK